MAEFRFRNQAGVTIRVDGVTAGRLGSEWVRLGAPVVPVESVADVGQGSGDSDEDAAPVVPVKRKPGRPPKK